MNENTSCGRWCIRFGEERGKEKAVGCGRQKGLGEELVGRENGVSQQCLDGASDLETTI